MVFYSGQLIFFKHQMFQYFLHSIFLIQCITSSPSTSLREWLNNPLSSKPVPITYIIRLENEETIYPDFKSKRSIAEGIQTDDRSFVAEIVKEIDTTRQKRAPENATSGRFPRDGINPLQGPKDIHLKANLRYHHQQRHPNGSMSGSYAQADPGSGQLKVMHYVNDDKGFREWPEGSEPGSATLDPYQPIKSPSGNIDIVTNSNNGMVPLEQNKQTRRGINPLDGSNLNFIPTVNAPYSVPTPIGGIAPTPILQSAAGSVSQFSPKSPLFDKYYRPSPEEVQKSYEYHRIRSSLDPSTFRPNDMTPIPDFPRDRQPELRSVYSEVQIPYSARGHEELPPTAYLGGIGGPPPSEAPPLTPGLAPITPGLAPITPGLAPLAPAVPLHQPPPPDMYVRSTPFSNSQVAYPQTLEPQTPIFVQSYDGQPFIPASTYSGPYLPNTATFNQPYPTNIPIYNGPLPQNVATYSQPAPENIPVYGQPPLPGYGQNIYYASASNAQPTITTKH